MPSSCLFDVQYLGGDIFLVDVAIPAECIAWVIYPVIKANRSQKSDPVSAPSCMPQFVKFCALIDLHKCELLGMEFCL